MTGQWTCLLCDAMCTWVNTLAPDAWETCSRAGGPAGLSVIPGCFPCLRRLYGFLSSAASMHLPCMRAQVQNAIHMGWAEYCAALVTATRMREDMQGRTLLIHNGDISYAECALLLGSRRLLRCSDKGHAGGTARAGGTFRDGFWKVTGSVWAGACRGFGYGWEVFMDMMAPLMHRAPYMVTQGAATLPRAAQGHAELP